MVAFGSNHSGLLGLEKRRMKTGLVSPTSETQCGAQRHGYGDAMVAVAPTTY